MRFPWLRCLFNRNAALFAVLLFLASCSGTKYVPRGELLLNRVDVKADNKEINMEELSSYVKQRENTRILGFLKFHMWLYNLSSPEKPESWLKRAGEAPQIFDETLALQSKNQLTQYLNNKGYYNATVDFTIDTIKNGKKSNLTYRIATGDPWLIGEVAYDVRDTAMNSLFMNNYKSRYLYKDAVFDLDLLDRERDHLVRFFQNYGYYFFSKPLIFFEADTIDKTGHANLEMFVELPQANQADSVRIFRPYRLRRYYFNVVLPGTTDPLSRDTLVAENHTFIFPENFRYKPNLFLRLNRINSSEWYHAGNAENTFSALNRLRQFRFINISFRDVPDNLALLDCHVDLTPLSRQSTSFDVEGTNTSGNLGVAGNLNYSHRNLFRGAEILNLKLKGAMERQQAFVSNESLDFNTRELGVEGTLIVPRLIFPMSLVPSFGNILPKSLFTLGYNFQQRPDYTRTISTLRIGYEWMTSEYQRHNWNLMDFNLVNLSSFDTDFLNSIYDLYIRESFTDHLILATNYSYVYNTLTVKARESYNYLRVSAESSGNFLNLFSVMTGARKTTETDTTGLKPASFYKLLDTRYAQYVKGDVEFRKGYVLDKYNSVVGRLFLGVGMPYGNFDVLPFEKKYFTGGANGIRAWQVRSLGPGTYQAPEGSYPNQSGDIKLEANLEYRFKLIKFLEGAFFLDAGNVWAINEKDNRPGAQFNFGRFYRQLALGTGTGLRFDFTYFVFRLDLGLKMRDPAQPEHNGWVTGARRLTGNDFNLSFAIGYPF